FYSNMENILPENKVVKTRSRKKHAEPGKDRYSISDSIWERLKDYGEKDIATELMTIKGVGFKRAAKMLSKNGKQVDEDALRKLYRKGKKVVNYQTTDDFCSEEGLKAFESKYSRSDVHITEGDDNLYASDPASEKSEDPIEENILELTEDDVYVEPGASYSSGPRKRPMDEEILELAEKPEEEEIIELTEVYDEPQDRKSQTVYQGIRKELKDFIRSHPEKMVEKLAKELMHIKEIEYKDIPKELNEFYKELGMKIDIPDSQIHEWYREMRKDHVKEGKWQIYDKFDEWAKAFVGTGEFSKETRGHLIRKKRNHCFTRV
ncbi:MAG: hypothetical protein MUP55_03785, partial [Candidatus Aenigmarchaeota archaeon]|nr:hypothetical protein [Candidatus Aenigmarchaeota archaeon]